MSAIFFQLKIKSIGSNYGQNLADGDDDDPVLKWNEVKRSVVEVARVRFKFAVITKLYKINSAVPAQWLEVGSFWKVVAVE